MKRFLDMSIILLFVPILIPVFLILIVLVRINLGSPVFFRQLRPGIRGKAFGMVKFRTMTNDCDDNGKILADEERLTRFGRFLRSSSLDELPELWNVLKGEMSLVGPRPLLTEYLSLYTDKQATRHNARPGITGWAQVNGRNTVNWDDRFELDVWYVENQSISLDLKILWLTIKKVLRREGISAEGEATMPKFDGSKK